LIPAATAGGIALLLAEATALHHPVAAAGTSPQEKTSVVIVIMTAATVTVPGALMTVTANVIESVIVTSAMTAIDAMTTGKMVPMVMTGKVGLFPLYYPLFHMKLT
jgi:hypothetical protein